MKLKGWIKRRCLRGRAVTKAYNIAKEQGFAAAIEYVRNYGRQKEILHCHINEAVKAPEEFVENKFKRGLVLFDGSELTLPKRPQEIYFAVFPAEGDTYRNASPGSKAKHDVMMRAVQWCRHREVLATPLKRPARTPHVLVRIPSDNFRDDTIYTAKSVYKLLAEIVG